MKEPTNKELQEKILSLQDMLVALAGEIGYIWLTKWEQESPQERLRREAKDLPNIEWDEYSIGKWHHIKKRIKDLIEYQVSLQVKKEVS